MPHDEALASVLAELRAIRALLEQQLAEGGRMETAHADCHAWQVLQPSGLCAYHELAARFGPDGPIPAPPLAGCPECAPALAAGIALLGRGQERGLSEPEGSHVSDLRAIRELLERLVADSEAQGMPLALTPNSQCP